MLKLRKSEKIVAELKRYKKLIDNIKYDTAKNQALKLLERLKSELNYIDQGHDPVNTKSIDPRTVRDNIKRTVEIRIQLDRIIKDSK